jgi:hypothetical protein
LTVKIFFHLSHANICFVVFEIIMWHIRNWMW